MNRKVKIILIAAGVVITPVLLSPMPAFRVPLSTVVEARDGSLLGARIADDGQWRFPGKDTIPEKFEIALLTFEDKQFYRHPGINPVSLVRALTSNIKAGRIVSGGSTISMQVARISRGGKERSYGEKLIEMLSALKLELFHSKKKILSMYCANAPFGGNTVGLEAAAWRYAGKQAADLTWAEAAALAVLPNMPSLVYPGKNQEFLKKRRDKLLNKLCRLDYIDSLTLSLSIDEPLPGEPKILPSKAPHLTGYFYKYSRGKRVRTTIDPYLQERVTEIINSHQKDLENNFIFNSACLVEDVETGNVLAYVGNSTLEDASKHGGDVDIIRSPRSTGSILKPILYAGMQQSGDILPNSIIADIPTRFPGFSPKNFDQSFSGAVPAGSALSQSLNIPAVRLLQLFSPERFLELLHKTGFTTFSKPADYYGLSMILGGGETTLWDLTGAYASLSRVLNHYGTTKHYFKNDYHQPVLIPQKESKAVEETEPALSAGAVWLTYQALQKVNRPESETGWQYFSSSPNLAWKTGTSYGFRDGWAVGTTPVYVAGVWTGNADGEGRPGLTGTTAAAPILFDVVNMMGAKSWFSMPDEEMTMIKVCSRSGFRAGPDCPETEEIWACPGGLRSEACPYHKVIHLNKNMTNQVTSECVPASEIINIPWFILPPAMEYFYRQKHPEYKTLPPFTPGCRDSKSNQVMEFIYPSSGVKIFIPRDQEGKKSRIIPEIAHRNPSRKIFWHIDERYVATTQYIHQINITAEPGQHTITAVDEDGNTIKCNFSVTGKQE